MTVGVFDHGVAHLPLWLMACAPGVGLAIAGLWLRYPGRGLSRHSADEYIIAFHRREGLGRPRHAAPNGCRRRNARQRLRDGARGSVDLHGRDDRLRRAAALAIVSGRRRPNLLLVAGAAAGIAAIFKAPATGAIFAIEVPFQEDLARRMLLPALIAAACGYLSSVAINGTTPLFPVHGAPPFSFVDLAGAALLGLLAGFGARLFAWMIQRGEASVAVSVIRSFGCCCAGATIAAALRDRTRPHRSIARAHARATAS